MSDAISEHQGSVFEKQAPLTDSANITEISDADTQKTETNYFLAQPSDPKLDISREQTPDIDNVSLSYTDSAPGSPSSGGEDLDQPRNASLDMDRATKIVKTEQSADTTSADDTPLFFKETQKKRVTGRAIAKQWVPLEAEAFKSVENLCEISMNDVMERFQHSRQRDSQVAETQRILTQFWLSMKIPKAFLARLKVTKLPSTKSLVVRMRGVIDNTFDPLNIDQVSLKMKMFESYLSAEKKQLEDLKKYKASLQATYESDLAYLKDFRKTTSALRGQNQQEKTRLAKELHLPSTEHSSSMKRKIPQFKPAALKRSRFDPDQDDDLQALLGDISTEASKLDSHKNVLALCDQLDVIERQLYSRNLN